MFLGRMYDEYMTRALLVGGCTNDDDLNVCCCALVDAYQDNVPNNLIASP